MMDKKKVSLILLALSFVSSSFCDNLKGRKKMVFFEPKTNSSIVKIDRLNTIKQRVLELIANGCKSDDILVVLDLDETVWTLRLPSKKEGKFTFIPSNYLWDYSVDSVLQRNLNNLSEKAKSLPTSLLKKIFLDVARDKAFLAVSSLQKKSELKTDIIERNIPKIINDLQDLGVKVIGLTSREWGMSKKTHKQLLDIGINLTKTAPSEKKWTCGENAYGGTKHGFYKGVLFLTPRAGKMDKGKLLINYLDDVFFDDDEDSDDSCSEQENTIRRVVFADDSYSNHENIKDSLFRRYPGMSFEGFWYLRTDDLKFEKKTIEKLLVDNFGKDWWKIKKSESYIITPTMQSLLCN